MTEALLINKFNTEKYKFEREGYVIRCTAMGDYTAKDAEMYIKIASAYFGTINNIEECILIVDARRQNVLRKEVLPYLEEVENLYINTPFASRKFLPLYDAKANMQVISMAGKRFYEMFEPIEEESEEYIFETKSDLDMQAKDSIIFVEKQLLDDEEYKQKYDNLYRLIDSVNNKSLQIDIESKINEVATLFNENLFKKAFIDGIKFKINN
ncbi:MAG: hypothetical protein N4A63_16945 [Vallitalea sp.]|jgi:hypothetical protein|nr:hypothetical protein [Vallitalea sp.]